MSDYFYQLVCTRQSDRGYLDTPLDRPLIEQIIEAARMAPSACNAQPWKFIVVDEPELRRKMAASTFLTGTNMNRFVVQAPVLIVLVMKKGNFTSELGSRVKRKHFPLIDIGIAAEHICLAAASKGLGSCMIGWFDEKTVSRLLQIPKQERPVLIITLGHRKNPVIREKKRKPLSEILSYNQYAESGSLSEPACDIIESAEDFQPGS